MGEIRTQETKELSVYSLGMSVMTDQTSGSQAQHDFFSGNNGELVYTSRDDDIVSYFVYPRGYFKDDVVPENTAKFLKEHPNYRCYIYAANAFGISKVRVYEFGSVQHEREYYYLRIAGRKWAAWLTWYDVVGDFEHEREYRAKKVYALHDWFLQDDELSVEAVVSKFTHLSGVPSKYVDKMASFIRDKIKSKFYV